MTMCYTCQRFIFYMPRGALLCSAIMWLMMCQLEIHCYKAPPTKTSVDPPYYRACSHMTEVSIFLVKDWIATSSPLKCQHLRYDTKSTRNKRSVNCTSPKLKIIVLQSTPWRKWTNLQNGRKYLEIIYLIRIYYPECITNSYNNKKIKSLNFKKWGGIEKTFLQRRYIKWPTSTWNTVQHH